MDCRELSAFSSELSDTAYSPMFKSVLFEWLLFYVPVLPVMKGTRASSRLQSQGSAEDPHTQPGPHAFWIGASTLCARYNREFSDFLRNQSTKDLLQALRDTPLHEGGMPNGPDDNSHMFKLGNSGGGREAWICPRLLVPLVHWLNPRLSVRLNHIMFKFLTGQMTQGHAEAAWESLQQVSPLSLLCSRSKVTLLCLC